MQFAAVFLLVIFADLRSEASIPFFVRVKAN